MVDKKEKEVKEVKSKFVYYRSKLAGLKTQVKGAVDNDPTTLEFVRFTPVKEKFQGDNIKVGYLKTDNAVAIKNFEGDGNVTIISKDEYEKAVKK